MIKDSSYYAKIIMSYLQTHESAGWTELYDVLEKPNPNTLNFVLHKLRFQGEIELVETWRIKQVHK